MKMIATRPFPYRGRILQAGAEFEAPPAHARALKAARRAAVAPMAAPPTAAPPAADPIDALRGQAEALGLKVDHRWRESRLREEIASAGRRTYGRRDMQAENT